MENAALISDATKRQQLLQRYMRGEFAHLRTASTIARRSSPSPAPLAPAQEGVWRRAQDRDLPPLYNESITIHRRGPLDVSALETVLAEIIRRHEIWRTNFRLVDGRPVQIVNSAPSKLKLPVIDLRTLPQPQREDAAHRVASEDGPVPFDLAEGPLLRCKLLRMEDEYYRLSMIVHQIILDGVSVFQVLLSDLAQLYEMAVAGLPPQLPDVLLQYGDFAEWHQQLLAGETLDAQLAYWRKQLDGVTSGLRWPEERLRPQRQTFRAVIEPFVVPSDLSESFRRLAQAERVSLFTALVAAFGALLHARTSQEDFILGTVSPAGRKRSEVQHLLGYFLNPVALRLKPSGNLSVRDWLRHTSQVITGAVTHDDVPFERVVEELRPRPDLSRNPFFNVATSLEPPLAKVEPAWSLTPMDVESGGGRWDLYLVFDDRPTGTIGRVQYNPDLLSRSTILDLLKDLQVLMRAMRDNPALPLTEICRCVT